MQHKHLASRKKGAVYLKGWVFRRRADENNAPVFHKGKKRILLRLVEAVNFIDKHDRPLAKAAV